MRYKINRRTGKPRYNLTPCENRRKRGAVRYIVVHYTGGTGSARNNVDYFRGGDRSSSADFFIDSDSIWRFNPDCRYNYSWHCGDGHGMNGITNANSIGIEVVSNGEDYSTEEKKRLRDLVGYLMKYYSVPASRVVRHYDASHKHCPYPYAGNASKDAKWRKLHQYIVN